jgi:drug/metabolite transporter superfamily protein YnfA
MKIVEKVAEWMLIIGFGYLLQLRVVEMAQAERGYAAYGGEYLVLPLVILIAAMIEAVWHVIKDERRGDV